MNSQPSQSKQNVVSDSDLAISFLIRNVTRNGGHLTGPQILHEAISEYSKRPPYSEQTALTACSLDACTRLLGRSPALYELLLAAGSCQSWKKTVDAGNLSQAPELYESIVDLRLSALSILSDSQLARPPPDNSAPIQVPSQPNNHTAAATTPINHQRQESTSASATILSKANSILELIVPALREIIAPDWKLKSWDPSNVSSSEHPEIHSWLSELQIPVINGEPNFLLHQLGNLQKDKAMDERLLKILNPDAITFLVNTSGSGKTRHLLEGLCRKWGFYFCSTQNEKLGLPPPYEKFGSADLMNCIAHRLLATEGFTAILPEIDFYDQLQRNRAIAKACLAHVLLARVLVFRAFLDSIIASGRKITTDDKRRWTFIQVHPALLAPSSDVFDQLAQALNTSATTPEVTAAICWELLTRFLHEQTFLLDQHYEWGPGQDKTEEHLYCVLDDLPLAFRSEKDLNIPRSVLREILVSFRSLALVKGAILAGTGVDKLLVDEQAISMVNKNALLKYIWTSMTGSFDKNSSPGLQEAYIRRYVPPTILANAVGKRLIKRIADWLEGRFRFTAAFLANLLRSDFKNPHQFLDDWVEYHTRFRPTDARDLTLPYAVYTTFSTSELYNQVDFARFASRQGTVAILTNAIYESLLRRDMTSIIENEDDSLVEAGFARYKSGDLKQKYISEPLILLASAHFIDNHAPYETLWQYLKHHVGSNKGSRNNGFENYIAFLIANMFATLTPLEDVFDFPELQVPEWAKNKRARLVVLSKEVGSNEVFTSDFNWPGNAVASGQLGCSLDPVGTKEWLNHERKIPFCFPPNNMGPDIMFVLQLEDGLYIWVAMQLKYLSDPITMDELKNAARSTVPAKYWIQKNGVQFGHVKYANLAQDTLDALGKLPGPDTGMRYPLLRVVVVSPPTVAIDLLDAISGECLSEEQDCGY
ncbi:hypothetical protein DFH07DRAFT_745947 [Mycena maculata]|uniref:Uncharacterized protein n=1 Tax=Mycena maculata TaxID=230809 RepID=A0AAD7IUY8_9AGAR|nr:hypothetical protein DFH07DRAFT_745947 [Mycena maculata]